jgi:cellulose biosynthesis protein BcsQ
MRVIAIVGAKGGSGKTAVAHLLAYGLGEAGFKVLLMQTDIRARMPPQTASGRPYLLRSINTAPDRAHVAAQEIAAVHHNLARIDNAVLIADGGAGRGNVDLSLAATADFVLVPCMHGPEDIDEALADRAEIVDHLRRRGRDVPVKILLSRWPGAKRNLESLLRRPYVGTFLRETVGARLKTFIPQADSVEKFLLHDTPEMEIAVRRRARLLAAEVAELLGVGGGMEFAEAV